MTTSPAKPFTGRHMSIIMLGFFAVVITANMAMVYFARHSWTGLVVNNSYVASQEFNERTAALTKAAEVHVAIVLYDHTITVTLSDMAGTAVVAKDVVLTVGRPSHEGEDQTLALHSDGAGTYSASHTLAHGQWSGAVTATFANQKNWSRPVYLLVKG